MYNVSQGETISDVVLNATGSIDNWNLIVVANNFGTFTPELSANQQIDIPDSVVIQTNVLGVLAKYPAVNNSGISNLDEQINELINIFTDNMANVQYINASGDITAIIPANSFVNGVGIKNVAGSPTIKIGTTYGGEEILPATLYTEFSYNLWQGYYNTATNIYINITGGTMDLRIDYTNPYYSA